jgi:segregation and condensation protein A
MIEARTMSISDVSLADVTDAFLAHVEKLPELPLGETAQFILVASTLLLIKSRSLLPLMELSEDERESVQELEHRLGRLRIIRATAKLLRKEWGRAPLLLAKRAPLREPVFTPSDASLTTILAAMRRLMSILPSPAKMAEAAVAPVLALEEVILRVKNRLVHAIRTKFSELTRASDRQEVIVYFLAMLELVRSGSASVSQEKLFEDITIELEHTVAPRYGA